MGYSGYVTTLGIPQLELTMLYSHWLDRGQYESPFDMNYDIPN